MPRSRERFVSSLNNWWSRQLAAAGDGPDDDWRDGRGVAELAAQLSKDLQFELAQATFLHRHPDLETARSAVERLEPPPREEDAALLAEAIVHAGRTSRRVRLTTAGAVLTALALVLRNVLRGR